MIWEVDSLLAKAQVFFERAFKLDPDEDADQFGLWCSLGLEFLARAAVSSVSPLLLAEPDKGQVNLLHALDRPHEKAQPKSITLTQVVTLCRHLFPSFTEDEALAINALTNRRNSELHTGEAAFQTYPAKQWLPSFYQTCSILTECMGRNLNAVLGDECATVAGEMLAEDKKAAQRKAQEAIAAHKKVFAAKSEDERIAAAQKAKNEANALVHERHHRVRCPACGSDALLQGSPVGPEQVTIEDDKIFVRQSISPRSFSCSACELKLIGYRQLEAADLGGTYTRRTTTTPQVFYGMIDPIRDDLSPFLDEYMNDAYSDMYLSYDND